MESIEFLVMLITIGWLLVWVIKYDKRPEGKTGGLFAMRDFAEDKNEADGKAGWPPPRTAPSQRRRS